MGSVYFNQPEYLSIAVDLAAKATVLFLAAMVASRLLARASAAVRHRAWCLAFCGVLLLPLLPFVVPQWTIAVLPAGPSVAGASASHAVVLAEADAGQLGWQNAEGAPLAQEAGTLGASGGPFATNGTLRTSADGSNVPMGLWIWCAGAIVLLLPLLAGGVHAALLRRGARPVRDAHWLRLAQDAAGTLGVRASVRLLVASSDTIPITWGALRPTVLLPASCDGWSEERKRLVLLHEFAHIKRLDLPWQWLARLACVVYWFHPLAWYALHRLQIEREQACDDCVIRAGEKASDYALELVNIAESYQAPQLAAALAMARSSKLEGRVKALLDQGRSHLPLGRRTGWGMLFGVVVLAAAVAAVRPVAGSAQAGQAPSPPESNATATPQEAPEPAAQASSEESPSASLSEEEKEAITLRNLKAITWAIHNYAEANNSEWPPAAVPNDNLPPEKRLSGFVLLLPYLGLAPSYITKDNPNPVWDRWQEELKKQNEAAKKLYATIDLTKAWNDPVNLPAAKTLVPLLVTPSGTPLRDERGFAVTHFAFVRGSEESPGNRDDGAFPLVGAEKLAILDIKDGTVNTLGIGEIHDHLGPWTAAGASSARLVLRPDGKPKEPTFGSQYEGCAHFAMCDSWTFFLDMAGTDRHVLKKAASRSGREAFSMSKLSHYRKAADWKELRK